MPPPPGGGKKKKKGRAPKHQNSFAFRHNPKSKKTEKILSSPNVGVCRRCAEKIEWRKKYRKYKPRSQPGKCNLCSQKNVLAAYHTICPKCATSEEATIAMEKRSRSSSAAALHAAPTSALVALTLANSQTPSPSSTDELGDDEEESGAHEALSAPTNDTDHNDNMPTLTVAATRPATTIAKRRRIRVCAICANEPALSRRTEAGIDGDLVCSIQELEETLKSGWLPGEERRLTLRERKGTERRIEKLELELRRRRTRRNNGEEEVGEEGGEGEQGRGGEGTCNSDSGGEEERGGDGTTGGNPERVLCEQQHDTGDDPFLMATKGKALVGEDYQQMLLAREQEQ